MFRRVRSLLGRAAPPLPSPPPRPPPREEVIDPVLATLAYHERTKHHPSRYAAAPPFMDWDTQPDPFRRYDGAPALALSWTPAGPEPRYEPAFLIGQLSPRPLDLAAISQLFQDALSISAWKQAGENRWALRMNPSSGNLHPTEGYLIAPALPGFGGAPAVWHYRADEHALERRATFPQAAWEALVDGLPAGTILVALSGITLRESWKYGERAYRYCQHDAGHAIAGLAIAAAGLGWDCRLLEGALDGELETLLGTAEQTGPEAERAEALLAIFPSDQPLPVARWASWRVAPVALGALREATWAGAPRALASDAHPWPILEAVARATTRVEPAPPATWELERPQNTALTIGDSDLSLRRILHQRRSAVDMDGRTGITAPAFYQMLLKLLPGRDQIPFQALPWGARVHLALWVHRVQGLSPGLYLLARAPDAASGLRATLRPSFAWSRPATCPEGLPLYLLEEGDRRQEAAGASCGQAIASDSCFAVAMIASLRADLEALGAPFYRRLHWEAGAIGQTLYLEAEASGVRATGIGCYFDDVTRRALGASDDLSVIYHFTVGGAVDDPRLQTLPPYAHLSSR